MTLDIGLDCDGVLCDFVGGTLEAIEGELGVIVDRESLTTFDFLDEIESAHAVDFVQHCLWKREGFCASLRLIDGAREGVNALREWGHVCVVTAPLAGNATWAHERTAWLAEHFGISKHDVIFADRKELVDVDVLIDDKLSNLQAWRSRRVGRKIFDAEGPGPLGMLWDTHTNRSEHDRHFARVTNWLEASLEMSVHFGPMGTAAG